MDGFSYYNIFDTKGIEYLAIIAFLVLLIPFWLTLNKRLKVKAQSSKSPGILSARFLTIPQGIFYSRNHTWAYLEKSGTAKIGLDELLLHITGDLKISHFRNSGDFVKKGDLLAEVNQNGKSLSIFSPISGKILNPNPALLENHKLINIDPYGKGWIYNIQPSDWKTEISSFFLAGEASDWLANELERYKDFLAINMNRYSPENSMTILQDGGELSDSSLSVFPDILWQDFQKAFLNLT